MEIRYCITDFKKKIGAHGDSDGPPRAVHGQLLTKIVLKATRELFSGGIFLKFLISSRNPAVLSPR